MLLYSALQRYWLLCTTHAAVQRIAEVWIAVQMDICLHSVLSLVAGHNAQMKQQFIPLPSVLQKH